MFDEAFVRSKLSAAGMTGDSCLSAIAKHPWFRSPSVEIPRLSLRNATYTLVVPVHNQEAIVQRFFVDHMANAAEFHDLVIVFDSCTDQSRSAFRDWLSTQAGDLLCSVVEICTSVPYFETACDNIGFVLANTPVVIECQVDLIVGTFGYDRLLLRVLQDERVSTASGRCGHSLRSVYARRPDIPETRWLADMLLCEIGLCGRRIETAGFDVDDSTGIAWFCETVNRGPLAFRKNDLQKFGYLDHVNLFLGDDDHDFNFRVWSATGQSPAYVPMKVRSLLNEGSTTKPRDTINQQIYDMLRLRPNHSALARNEDMYNPYLTPTPFRIPG